jgi:hypothetical protein
VVPRASGPSRRALFLRGRVIGGGVAASREGRVWAARLAPKPSSKRAARFAALLRRGSAPPWRMRQGDCLPLRSHQGASACSAASGWLCSARSGRRHAPIACAFENDTESSCLS